MKVRNVSPLGDLHVAGVGLVEAGEEVTVRDDELAEGLLSQPANFAPADAEAEKLRAAIAKRETPPAGDPPAEDPPAPRKRAAAKRTGGN